MSTVKAVYNYPLVRVAVSIYGGMLYFACFSTSWEIECESFVRDEKTFAFQKHPFAFSGQKGENHKPNKY